MDISRKGEVLVCAHESGYILLWSLDKNKRLTKIKPPDKSSILCVKFLYDTKQYLLVSTSKGSLYQYKVQDSLFKVDADKTLLMFSDKSQAHQNPAAKSFPEGFFNIQILPVDDFKDHPLCNYTVIALASMEKVMIVVLEPEFRIVFISKRNPVVPDHVVPCISWGRGCVPGNLFTSEICV